MIILSMHGNEEYASRAIQAGAAGYLLKDSGLAELELGGPGRGAGRDLSQPGRLQARHRRLPREHGGEPPPESGSLTPRQREVLRLIAEGKTTKAIARLLGVSVKTVETHRAQLMDRLDIHDVAGLVRHAIRIGLIEMDRGPGRPRPAPERMSRPQPARPGEPRWPDAETRENPDVPSGSLDRRADGPGPIIAARTWRSEPMPGGYGGRRRRTWLELVPRHAPPSR